MERGFLVITALCCCVPAFVSSSHAQMRSFDPFQPDGCTVMDGVVFRAPGAANGAFVEVRAIAHPAPAQSSPIHNGAFTFTCVSHGAYELRVLNSQGMVIHSEQVEVRASVNSVQVVLPSAQTEAPASPWVSVRQLSRKANGKAQRELRKARAAIEGGRLEDAIKHSRMALERDPEYPEAFVELGAAYALLERHEEAAEQFTKAAELDPDSVRAHSNLAIAMLKLQRFEAAEAPARRALKIAHPLPAMHYALGVSLGVRLRNVEEAIEHLDRAAASFPRARLLAVQILAAAGRRFEAVNRIEEQLRSTSSSDERKEFEALRTRLR